MELERVIGFSTGKIVFRVDDSVVKIFDHEHSKAEVLNEALNQARMEETDLDIPKILEVTKIQGKWAIISQYIAGDTLEHLMQKNPEQKKEYLSMMVELQIKVQSHKLPFLNKMSDVLTGRLEESELSATTRYNLIGQLGQMERKNCLCHGNFHPQNIIVGKDGKLYLLNFANAVAGNPHGDVAKTALLLYHTHGRELAEEYLALYCEKSEQQQQEIQKWFKIVAGAELSVAKEWNKPLLHQFIESKETAI